jgi:hypothetical protein
MTVLTQAEADRFLELVERDRRAWANDVGRELLRLPPNERDLIVLAAVHLDARLADFGLDAHRQAEAAGGTQPATEDAGKPVRERETSDA